MGPAISGVSFGVSADAFVERGDGKPVLPDGIILDLVDLRGGADFSIGGHFKVECFDPDGNLKWSTPAKNGVTDAGIASVLGVYFQSQTQITTWYLGLIDNAGFTALAAADTMSSHAGWSEVASANYSNTTRPSWGPGAPSGGSVANGTPVSFNMTNSGALSVYGVFLVSESTKAGTAGTLFATAAFSGGVQACNSGDTIKVTYTCGAASTS